MNSPNYICPKSLMIPDICSVVFQKHVHDWESSTAVTYWTTGGQRGLRNLHLAIKIQVFVLIILKPFPSDGVVYVVYVSVGQNRLFNGLFVCDVFL